MSNYTQKLGRENPLKGVEWMLSCNSILAGLSLCLKGFWYFLNDTKHKLSQIYSKLTRFKDDGRKRPLKYYLLRCCSFFRIE